MSKPIEILVQETLDKLADPKLECAADVKDFYRTWMDAVWNYQCPSMLFDFYTKDIHVYRENGDDCVGIFAVVKEVAAIQAAFPDMKIRVASMVVNGDPENGYQIWARTYFNGTNLGYSKYGPPTGKKLEGDLCMNLDMLKLEQIGGKWKVVQESLMRSARILREVMGGPHNIKV